MNQSLFTVTENTPLTAAVYRLRLRGDTAPVTTPGQFVNIALPGCFLRRPISVCDKEGDTLTLLYKAVGRGTEEMTRLTPGDRLDLLAGLGNGYDLAAAGDAPLLLGGGVGVPPLYWLARELRRAGKPVTAVLGFNTAGEVFYEKEFRRLGCAVAVTTADGSYGRRGFVTDALPEGFSHFYACGPGPMLRAVCQKTKTSGQVSLEERMGCGFGACMGCSVLTAAGPKRVCRDGPVFRKEALLWDD